MKKGLLLSLLCMVLLCGCKPKGNLVTCTGESIDDNKNKSTTIVTAKIEKKVVTAVSAEIKYLDEETANQYLKLYEVANSFAEREEDKYSVSLDENDKKVLKIHDYAFVYKKGGKGDLINLSKEDFIKKMEESKVLKCK